MELSLDQALQKGIEAHKAGQIQKADQYYTAILKANPKHPDANHNMGVLAVGVGKVVVALPFFKTALEANTSIAQYWLSYIDALMKLERVEEAKAVFDQAKSNGAKGDGFDQLERQFSASSVEVGNETQKIVKNQSNILDKLTLNKALKLANKKALDGNIEDSRKIYLDVLTKFPKNKKALDGVKKLSSKTLANLSDMQEPTKDQLQDLINLFMRGQHQKALDKGSQLLEQFPNSVILYNIDGVANQSLGRLEEAVDAFKKALSIKPNYADAYYNMGIALKQQGKLEEAITAYTKAITIKPEYSEAYNSMGIALKEQGKLEEAVDAFKKALSTKPDYADAYYNMGIALKEQGKLEEAVDAYNKAISIKPDYADAYYNMGVVLQEQSKLEEAIEAYTTALSIKPDYAAAYNNMGVVLQEQSKLEEAIEAYTTALSIKSDYAAAYNNMGVVLKGIIFSKPNRNLQKTIVSLLDNSTYVRPKDIAKAAISLLNLEPKLQKHLQLVDADVTENPLDVISDINEFPLLLKLMSVCPLPDLELEKLLQNLRRSFLSNISSLEEASVELLRFQSALALQCFTNEYIYSHTEEEEEILQSLDMSVKNALKNKEQPSPQIILAMASYKALHQYEWCNLLVVTDDIKEVYSRQVEEPNQEEKLKQDLPILEEITDSISSEVRAQYEASPYPRWVNLGLTIKPFSIPEVVEGVNLRLHSSKITEVEKPEILIAGCGTGQHSIGTAARFKGSKVLAIDLSLSSLAYAKRKTKELAIENIEYMQADILDLAKLNKQFDIIESSGVLHHMDDPAAGWKVLTDCLKPGGLMRIGLYSALARQHIEEIRKEISKAGIGSSDAEMKSYRDTLSKSDKDYHKQGLTSNDLYSVSELRDLLFHVQEHRFTIAQLKECLDELGLKFCGFEADTIIRRFEQTNKDKDDLYDLDKWQAYEEANPRSFAGMYQFWCQKVR